MFYTRTITTYVVELGEDHDIILGNDWLVREKAELSYLHNICVLHPGGGESIPIPIRKSGSKSQPSNTSPISVLQAKRLQRKGAKLFMVNVIDTGVTPYPSTDEYDDPVSSATDPAPSGTGGTVGFPTDISTKVRSVLNKYQRLFVKRQTFPKDQGIEHVINLEPGTKPPYRAGYRLSPAELVEVERSEERRVGKECRSRWSPYH